IAAVPSARDLVPAPSGEDGQLTVDDIEAAAPAFLAVLVARLREELPDFLGGAVFNSGFAFGQADRARTLVIRQVRPPVRDRHTGRTLLAEKAVLVLDATPVPEVLSVIAPENTQLPPVAPTVAWPAGARVVQIADAFGGVAALKKRGGRPRRTLLTSLRAAARDYPGDHVAAITHHWLKDEAAQAL